MNQLLSQILDNLQLLQSLSERRKNLLTVKYGFSRVGFGALYLILRKGEINGKELAHLLGVTTSAVTQITDSLVRDGFLDRKEKPTDRRIVLFCLTDRGKEIITEVVNHVQTTMIEVLSECSQKELEIFLKIQTKLLQKLEQSIQ